MLINASIFAEYDNVNGVSANVMLGQQPPCGTGDVSILLDEEHLMELIKDMQPVKLENIAEEEDDDDEICVEDDIKFNFKLTEPHKCFNMAQQKIKIV